MTEVESASFETNTENQLITKRARILEDVTDQMIRRSLMLPGKLKYFGRKDMLQVLDIAIDPGNGNDVLDWDHMSTMIKRISSLNQLKALNIILQITWVEKPEEYESSLLYWSAEGETEISSLQVEKLGVPLKNLRKLEKFSIIAKEKWYTSSMGDGAAMELVEALALHLNPHLQWLFVCPVKTKDAVNLAYRYPSLKQLTFQYENGDVEESLKFLRGIPIVNCGIDLKAYKDAYGKHASLYYNVGDDYYSDEDEFCYDGDTPAPMKVFKEILNQTGKRLKYLHVKFLRDSMWKVGVENWIRAFYERVSDPKAFLILDGPGEHWWTNRNLGLSPDKDDPFDNDEVKDPKVIEDFLKKIEETYPNVALNYGPQQGALTWIISIVNQCCERAQLGLLKELYDQRKPLTEESGRIVEEYIQNPFYEMGAH